MQVYLDNKALVERHNRQQALGQHSYTVAINGFSDLSREEWRARLKSSVRPSSERSGQLHQNTGKQVPDSLDYRDQGAVTAVGNQGQCGSCWAFTALGSFEGMWKLAGNELVALSAQQLMDCDTAEYGCEGGFMDTAFKYIKDNGGLDADATYPYTGESKQCRASDSPVASLSGWADIAVGSEADLLDATANKGPVAMAVDASHYGFQMYKSGVYDEPSCSNTIVDHSATIVGYGTEEGKQYWLVKNSWGTEWGDEGYIKMSKGKNNQCGIASEASYAII